MKNTRKWLLSTKILVPSVYVWFAFGSEWLARDHVGRQNGSEKRVLKEVREEEGSSLVVQWLALGAFTAMVWVQSLVGELRSPKPHSLAKKKKNERGGEGKSS